jgi:hypothetical protein
MKVHGGLIDRCRALEKVNGRWLSAQLRAG